MRKHDVRKWLHAILDLLPVIIIPVFMIYSHRHTIDNYSITRDEPLEKNFYQGVINGRPSSLDGWSSDFPQTISQSGSYLSRVDDSSIVTSLDIFINDSDICYFSYFVDFNEDIDVTTSIAINGNDLFILDEESIFYDDGLHKFSYIFENDSGSLIDCDYISFLYFRTSTIEIRFCELFNLTQIFGSGNEPTKDVFESYLTKDYYDFGNNSVVVGTHQVTYDDTDIGSQMFYCLYNSVDKYFNMGNVFNMTGVYDWFVLNIFGGNAPLSMYVVWNIVLYEFVMDLMFLLYGLFMWFIDMVEKLMEKPINSVK